MDPNIFGSKIAELRQKHNLTQKEFAEKLSLSAKMVSKWETGRSLPNISYMPKIATIFAMTIDELMLS